MRLIFGQPPGQYQIGQKPNVEQLVRDYPEFEDRIRQKFREFKKVDSLFDSLGGADESDFIDTSIEPDLMGRIIGGFEIGEVIGRGGMGVVYKAEETGPIRRVVAVKKIRGDIGSRFLERFEWERKALARMRSSSESKPAGSVTLNGMRM